MELVRHPTDHPLSRRWLMGCTHRVWAVLARRRCRVLLSCLVSSPSYRRLSTILEAVDRSVDSNILSEDRDLGKMPMVLGDFMFIVAVLASITVPGTIVLPRSRFSVQGLLLVVGEVGR